MTTSASNGTSSTTARWAVSLDMPTSALPEGTVSPFAQTVNDDAVVLVGATLQEFGFWITILAVEIRTVQTSSTFTTGPTTL